MLELLGTAGLIYRECRSWEAMPRNGIFGRAVEQSHVRTTPAPQQPALPHRAASRIVVGPDPCLLTNSNVAYASADGTIAGRPNGVKPPRPLSVNSGAYRGYSQIVLDIAYTAGLHTRVEGVENALA
jgi:hypothetical protein